MRKLMRMIGIGGLIAVMMTIGAAPAAACSGGGPFLMEWLPESDAIVYATVIDVDDRGYNAVLDVHAYFKGSGGEYLAVQRWTPALYTGRGLRGYDTGCLYGGGGEQWRMNTTGYFVLNARADGTYFDDGDSYSGGGHFIFEGDTVEVYTRGARDFQSEQVTEPELQQLFLNTAVRPAPIAPTPGTYPPLMRYLHITTENGTRYQVNPDRSVTALDPYFDPLVISPDGAHVIFNIDEETIGAQYIWTFRVDIDTNRSPWFIGVNRMIPIPGRGAVFSPDSNLMAVWTADTMSVYLFSYVTDGSQAALHVQMIGEAPITLTERRPAPEIVWSGNNQVIAFRDAAGLWVWNLHRQVVPTMLLPTLELRARPLLDLSHTGRYVRYGSDTNWVLLDTVTRDTFANAVAAPDESRLIRIDPPGTEIAPDPDRTIGGVEPECLVPLTATCQLVLRADGLVTWYFYSRSQPNDTLALVVYNERVSAFETLHFPIGLGRSLNAYPNFQGFSNPYLMLAYDEQFDRFAYVTDPYRIAFALYWAGADYPANFVPDAIDLTGVIDSPIASVEWGQPIFYVDETR